MPYRKKIFDIIPPKEKKAEDLTFLGVQKPTETKLPSSFKKVLITGDFSRFWRSRVLIIFSIIVVTVIAGCYFFIEPQALVEIWPKTEISEFKTSLQASAATTGTNFSQKLIPAVSLELERTISQEFSSSVTTTREKAHGIIRVYNKYYETITLIKDTRFLPSDSDVEFLSQRRIIIPAGGFTDVEVIAAVPGEEYNISPRAFVIPNLRKFSPPRLYYDITGRSFSQMTGGRIAEIPRVSAQDLEKAEVLLTERVFNESRAALEDEISEDIIILEETIDQEVIEVSPFAKVGQEIERFVVQMKVRTRALGVKKSDLENFVKDYVLTQITSDKELYTESLNINYNSKTINLKEGKITLALTISAGVYSRIDEELLKEIVKGKDPIRGQQDILMSFPEISRVQVKNRLLWQKKVPQNPKNIEIKLNF